MKRAQLAMLYFNPALNLDSNIIFQMMVKSSQPPSETHQSCSNSEHKQQHGPLWRVQPSRRKTKKTPESTDEKEIMLFTSNRFQVLSEQAMPSKVQGTPYVPRLLQRSSKNSNNNEKSTGNLLNKKIKLSLYSDSQGRCVQRFIEEAGCGQIEAVGFVYPNAGLLNVANCAEHASEDVIVLIGGTNDSLTNNLESLYESLEKNLTDLSKNKTILLTTIPRRFDADILDPVHRKIDQLNSYMGVLAERSTNVHLIDLDSNNFKYFHFSKHGLHLNIRGKRKLGFVIRDTLASIFSGNESCGYSSQLAKENSTPATPNKMTDSEPIQLIETHMAEVIRRYEHDEKVGFAHSISADFSHPGNMTAGVAVVFKACFGKPGTHHRLTNHLAQQNSLNGASVYSLITKTRYFGKPHKIDYDIAFTDFTESFKRRGLRHLICSPIGCIRDRVDPSHFVDHILRFQQKTKAKVTIVCYSPKPDQILKNGLSNKDFMLRLKHLIREKSRNCTSLNDDLEAVSIEPVPDAKYPVAVANDPVPSQVEAETTHSGQTTIEESPTDLQLTLGTSSLCEKVIVAPGDLTYKEALEQRNGGAVSVEMFADLSDCTAQLPTSTLNLMHQTTTPIK